LKWLVLVPQGGSQKSKVKSQKYYGMGFLGILNGEQALQEGFPTEATGEPEGLPYLRRSVLVSYLLLRGHACILVIMKVALKVFLVILVKFLLKKVGKVGKVSCDVITAYENVISRISSIVSIYRYNVVTQIFISVDSMIKANKNILTSVACELKNISVLKEGLIHR
jgi:hypothetical protein